MNTFQVGQKVINKSTKKEGVIRRIGEDYPGSMLPSDQIRVLYNSGSQSNGKIKNFKAI